MSLNTNFTDPEVIGNYIEGVFWVAVGVVLVIMGCKTKPAFKRLAFMAGGVFAVFGVSDFVEAQTGAWWRPLWLLLWKASCIVVLAVCYWKYRRIRTNLANQTAGP